MSSVRLITADEDFSGLYGAISSEFLHFHFSVSLYTLPFSCQEQ